MYKNIIPECYIDTFLANCFIGAKNFEKGTNHAKGVPAVFKKLNEKFDNRCAIALIDKDKKTVKGQEEFEIINNTIEEFSLLYKHITRHHYLIQLCPESETWICKSSRALGIDLLKDFGLPNDPVALSKITKGIIGKDEKFEKLFGRIIAESDAQKFEPVIKMKGWMEHIHSNGFQADLAFLRK